MVRNGDAKMVILPLEDDNKRSPLGDVAIVSGEPAALQPGEIRLQPLRIKALHILHFPIPAVPQGHIAAGTGHSVRVAAEGRVAGADGIEGQRGKAPGHDHGKEREAYDQRAGASLRGVEDVFQAIPQGCGVGGEAGGKAPRIPRRGQQQLRILPPLRLRRVLQHLLVAAQLQVLGAAPHAEPHQRVEPAHGGTQGQEQFCARVLVPDVDQLVAEDQLQLLRRVIPLRQQHPDRPSPQSDGDRRNGAGRDHQTVRRLLHGNVRLRLLPPGQNIRIHHGPRAEEHPAAEDQV